MPCHGAPRRLDLPGGHPFRLHRLEPEGTEIQLGAALGSAFDPALELLAELGPFRLQHVGDPASC
jgi:hypothetical protein